MRPTAEEHKGPGCISQLSTKKNARWLEKERGRGYEKAERLAEIEAGLTIEGLDFGKAGFPAQKLAVNLA